MDEYTKENLEKLFYYGSKVLEALEQSANEKDIELQNANRRYENLRGDVQNVLDKYKD